MKVILLQDIRDQGKKGQIIEAADGYARNYLIPRKLAAPATSDVINAKNISDEAAARHQRIEKENAIALGEKLKTLPVTIHAKAGTGGRLFGSVTAKEISEELALQHKIDVPKNKIILDDTIKNFGTYQVRAKLFPEVVGTLIVHVAELEQK